MKVLLYYLFVDIKNPEELVEEMRAFCKDHNLKGRILISKEGINGTCGGSEDDAQAYLKYMRAKPEFETMWFKEHELDRNPFPRMQIRVRDELVTLRMPAHPNKGGEHIDPEEVNKLAKDPNTVFFDARNEMEFTIGHFKNAINPHMKTFRDLPAVIEANKEKLAGKKVIMYCTGGIRCEVGSVIMKDIVPDAEVYQINGGIYNYCQSQNNNLWQGTCYVFDDRINVGWDEDGNVVQSADMPSDKIISECEYCQKKTSRVVNDERHLERVERVCCETCDKAGDVSRMRTKEERAEMLKK